MEQVVLLEVCQGAQISQIRAEDNGEECLVVAGDVVSVVMAVGTLEDMVDLNETRVGGEPPVGVEDLLILLHAMSVGAWPFGT